jgi:hypothetical protein
MVRGTALFPIARPKPEAAPLPVLLGIEALIRLARVLADLLNWDD